MAMERTLCIPSPVGPLTLTATEEALTGLRFGGEPACEEEVCKRLAESPLLRRAVGEIESYFAGRLRRFTLPLAPAGTPFQRAVWEALREIPYGKTRSYGAVAARIGHPRAVRAVGMANHRNPVAILIPCHRVVGADGSLTGYAGGLETKRRLLALERE